MSNHERTSDEFKNLFKVDRTRGEAGKIEFPDGLNNILKNETFSPEKITLGTQTTHSSGQKAVQIFTPQKGELIMYQDAKGWIPIEGYYGKRVIPMAGLENNNYVKDLIKHLNTNGIG
jgi:hypothetical protein